MRDGQGYYSQRIAPSPRRKPWKYDGWARGQNSFAEDNEIRDTEFYEGINIELVGKSSVRLPRRGSTLFCTVAGASVFNGCGVLKNPATSYNKILAMFDGRLYSIDTAGTETEIDNAETWDATAKMRGISLHDYFYFGNAVDYLAKTDGLTITRWAALTKTTLVSLVLTGSGSDTLYAYTVTTVSSTGETDAPTELTVFGPATLDSSNYPTITWVRDTSSDVRGYNIYKTENDGTLTLLAFIDQQASGTNMSYADKGVETRSLIHEVPTFNTTGGVKGNIFAKYANSLFISGNLTNVDTVFYGGTGINWESFSPSDNGGWVQPGRGDGDKVTSMIGFDDFLIIFKENSVWKFTFGSDGGPTLTAVIPQYGTSSPDTVWRMEKDVVFLGTDGRYRVLGYEPTQLNVIRTTDISNRIQPDLDALDKTVMDDFHAIFFEQKFILCNGSQAYPYDRRYLAFLGKWTNYNYDRFIIWDAGTGKQMLYGVESGTGKIYQILADGTYDDNGTSITASLRVKRVDGGEDTILKYFYELKVKLKNPRGDLRLYIYKDGSSLVSTRNVTFDIGGGVGEYMWDEPMWDEGISIDTIADALFTLKKYLEFESYSFYPTVEVIGNEFNHCIVQTMSGTYEVEDIDYERDETIVD